MDRKLIMDEANNEQRTEKSRKPIPKLFAIRYSLARGFTLLLAALVASIALSSPEPLSILDRIERARALVHRARFAITRFMRRTRRPSARSFGIAAATSTRIHFCHIEHRYDPCRRRYQVRQCERYQYSSGINDANDATTTFEIDSLFKDVSPGGYCAYVQVAKSYNSGATKALKAHSSPLDGYNVGCPAINTAPRMRCERTVELQPGE